jgi:hypothetical protein
LRKYDENIISRSHLSQINSTHEKVVHHPAARQYQFDFIFSKLLKIISTMNINCKLLAAILAMCHLLFHVTIVIAAPTIEQNDIFIDSITIMSQAIRIYPKSHNNTSRVEHYRATGDSS